MSRIKIAPTYEDKWLEVERPQPLMDKFIESIQYGVLNGNVDKDISDKVYDNFKTEVQDYLNKSTLNKLYGLDSFNRVDIINGCTQFIDNLYMSGSVQVLRNDYKYHQRLGYAFFRDVGSLITDIPLIIAMPFPQIGMPHTDMNEILDEALAKNIDVHIDGAWITCCRDIEFDFTHPAIKSVGVSLSKGLGLGWNRIGLRWSKNQEPDSISIMNDFNMNNRALCMIGLQYIRNIKPDYLWLTHAEKYYKICNDFGLTPTKSIYLALRNDQPLGLSPLIRYLDEQ